MSSHVLKAFFYIDAVKADKIRRKSYEKRLLSAILSFFMLLTMAPTVAFAADGDDEAAHQNNSVLEGSCGAEGDNVTWKLTENDDSPVLCDTQHNLALLR